MRIVFMGTPQFAAVSLQALLDGGHQVVGVFTQPDKPKGRGYKMLSCPVKELAIEKGIPVFQPISMRQEESFNTVKDLAPQLVVVAAYGQILPESMLKLPKYGCINVHASLLPKYRGASPIQTCILAGEMESGVTIMQMEKGLDTGDMLLWDSIAIGENETADSLHDRLADLGGQLLLKAVEGIISGGLNPVKQDDSKSSYAHMITKDMGYIDFNQDINTLHNKIRALNAYTYTDGKRLKILEAAKNSHKSGAVGQLLEDNSLVIGCNGGALELKRVQLEGAKAVSGADFLRGQRLAKGYIFSFAPKA